MSKFEYDRAKFEYDRAKFDPVRAKFKKPTFINIERIGLYRIRYGSKDLFNIFCS